MAIAENLVFAHNSLFRELQAPKFWKNASQIRTPIDSIAADSSQYQNT